MKYSASGSFLLASCLLAMPAAQAAFQPGADGLPSGWQLFRITDKVPATRYTLENAGVLHAVANHSMAGVLRKQRVDLAKTPLLCWRWKVKAVVAGADMLTKAGDDYAARLYVFFDVPASTLGLSDRVKIRLARSLYGAEIPTAAINYVWDARQPVGTLRPNAYTDRTRMLVLASGNADAGQWKPEIRDLAQDFKTAFGQSAPAVTGLAIATDTDNTGGTAEAWFEEPRFVARAEQCTTP